MEWLFRKSLVIETKANENAQPTSYEDHVKL